MASTHHPADPARRPERGRNGPLIHWGNDDMKRNRFIAAAGAAALLGLAAGSPWASAADGVAGGGTTGLAATVLGLEIGSGGDILAVRVLDETSTSNIDPAKGAPTSGASITPLSVSSSRVP